MQNENKMRYDRLIFDGARFIAEICLGAPDRMRATLLGLGGKAEDIDKVVTAMNDPNYREGWYRGAKLDEIVIENIKDVLRPIAGF